MADPATAAAPAAAAPSPPAKPTLATVHDSVRKMALYALEVTARMQAAGAPNVQVSAATMQQLAQGLTDAMVQLESLGSGGNTGS